MFVNLRWCWPRKRNAMWLCAEDDEEEAGDDDDHGDGDDATRVVIELKWPILSSKCGTADCYVLDDRHRRRTPHTKLILVFLRPPPPPPHDKLFSFWASQRTQREVTAAVSLYCAMCFSGECEAQVTLTRLCIIVNILYVSARRERADCECLCSLALCFGSFVFYRACAVP